MLFKNIVLIDDDDAINYYHKYIIENENITKDLFVLSEIELAESVLADLCEKPPEEINPSLIFIDVNMPRYTGFQFIEQNKSMFEKLKAKGAKIYMLTTSANPNDIADSESQPDVEGLYQKPLSIEKIEEIWKSTTI